MSDIPSFAEFFRAVWARDPHRWQVDLAEQVVTEQRWPDVIDLPTGAGKTACLDIAVYTLAIDPAAFPRRVAFVVDRRLIVDQTVERARQLADALTESLRPDTPPTAVSAIAERLVALSFQSPGRQAVALDVGRLRGGDADRTLGALGAAEWLRWPDQPAVIVSTVDQFGSRLLFRGYGIGSRMLPIHAGLTGNDCLVLLDEVHISAPLAETLGDLASVFSPVRQLPRRWQFVQMSATPIGDPPRRFGLESQHVVPGSQLAQVVGASKPARLAEVGTAKQSDAETWRVHVNQLVEQLGVSAGVIGVVVNRVASARAAAEALEGRGEVVLLTGRMRPLERARAEERARALADPDRSEDAAVAFVVATQCIEVGADLSFDGLITEVSTFSSLKQRFGRLDRRGRSAAAGRPAPALVVGVASALGRERDPVYGMAMQTMWHELRTRFGDGEFDVGPNSIALRDLPEGVDTPVPHPAVLMPVHLDLLAMTNPAPPTSPEVGPFLRGFDRSEPDVSVVWRADIGCTQGSLAFDAASLALLPPSPLEMVAVPRSAAVRWLTSASAADIADVDQVDDGVPAGGDADRAVLRWRSGEPPERVPAREIVAGDVIVVPSAYGGLSAGAWAPDSTEPASDVAGSAAASTGRRVVRTAVDLGLDGPADPSTDAFASFVADLAECLETRAAHEPWISGICADQVTDVGPVGHPMWVIIDRDRPDVVSFDGSDEANSAIGSPAPVTLSSHLIGVGALAAAFAEHCLLPAEIVSDFRLAGELHDLGKADPRFQVMLHGDEIKAIAAAEPLAKSTHRRWRFRGGYPDGMRHEYASAELIASSADLLAEAHDPDLVMHLVTTHHGHGRALPVHVADDDPQDIEIESHGQLLTARSTFDTNSVGVRSVERFALLNERYGWHGLAWLESLFRLADHRRSEEESYGTAS